MHCRSHTAACPAVPPTRQDAAIREEAERTHASFLSTVTTMVKQTNHHQQDQGLFEDAVSNPGWRLCLSLRGCALPDLPMRQPCRLNAALIPLPVGYSPARGCQC